MYDILHNNINKTISMRDGYVPIYSFFDDHKIQGNKE